MSISEQIQRLRLRLLVHSCIYYKLGTSLVDDRVWDSWAKELIVLQDQYSDIAATVCWSSAFEDWDGSSGFQLPLEDPWVMGKAKYLLRIWNKSFAVDHISSAPLTKPKKKKLF